MKHFDWKEMYGYAAGEASSEELERHLADCPLCKAEFEKAKIVIETLGQTGELDSIRASHIVHAAWDSRRVKTTRRVEFRPSFALVPLALVFVIVASVWVVIQGGQPKGTVEVAVKSTILKDAKLAAKEIGLDKVEVDFALLEESESDFKLEDVGVELPDESMLPGLTSSYLSEVLEVENTDELLKELGIKESGGQTRYGRLT